MDEERERQRRDLQRATELLETMSREELVDMLHDILYNERSDDTRKLSDWMAFQIIIQDETRDARMLLAQLGKAGRAHLSFEASALPGTDLTIPKYECQGNHDELTDDSCSAISFETCPEAEFPPRSTTHESVNIDATRTTDESRNEMTLEGVYGKSQSISQAKETRSGAEKHPKEEGLLPSTAKVSISGHGNDQKPSWLQEWSIPALQRDTQVSSESSTSEREDSQPRPLLVLPSTSPGAAAFQDSLPQPARQRESIKNLKSAMVSKSPESSNKLGHRNLAELYARFDNVRLEGWRADLLEIDARKGFTHNGSMSSSIETFQLENASKRKCHFCDLYFTAEQNVRELDNGSSPCSHHPGKKYARPADSLMTNDSNKFQVYSNGTYDMATGPITLGPAAFVR